MSLMTTAPAVSPFANDPFYSMGIADAYDEHQAGETVDTLKQRAADMLEADTRGQIPAELYRVGYATAIAGLLNFHIATVNAQADVAHTNREEQAA
ncbi:hypothetical protein [Streptomyces sp. NPDC058295]|uniref:hypothetical protein n=1 Tax=Streptomyces sp. NPDC058295 TaxID=3346431 RepID=UPI0036F09207